MSGYQILIMRRIQISILLIFSIVTISKGQVTVYDELSDAAIELTTQNVVYDPGYFRMSYPNGDVPPGKGVCTDVIIRAYRKIGIDLQKEVHEDMMANFSKYPKYSYLIFLD